MWRASSGAVLAMSLSGCLVLNFDFDGATSQDATGSETTGGETSSTPTSSTPTSSGAASTSSSTASTSGGLAETTGQLSSGGEEPATCLESYRLAVNATPWDAGVVPATMGSPCPWGVAGPCEQLSFGTTAFYRLVHDPMGGRNAALVAFPAQAIVDAVIAAGHDPMDIASFALTLIVWEPKAVPDGDISFAVELLALDDSAWYEGQHDAAVGVEGESTFECRKIDAGGCTPWSEAGGAQAAVMPLGVLVVTPETAAATDMDMVETEYHAEITSAALPAGPVLQHMGLGADPTFVVSLDTPRGLAEEVIGLKLKEAGWPDPALAVEICTLWSG